MDYYYIDGRKLSPVTNHPYLGVMLSVSNDLKWNSHMNNVVDKDNESLGFVKWNLYPCTETTKRSGYVTIVRATLEYTTAVWHPYRRTGCFYWSSPARFIKRDYNRTSSVIKMFKSLMFRHKSIHLPISLSIFTEFTIAFFCPTTWVILKQLDPSPPRATDQ